MVTMKASNDGAKTILCIGGRCSTWGKSWKKHLYDGGETCLRCGIDREEQFNEDKFSRLVTGAYVPNTSKTKTVRPITSKQIMYCAVGEEGVEFADSSPGKVKQWVKDQLKENDIQDDYYYIDMYTKQELALMPED